MMYSVKITRQDRRQGEEKNFGEKNQTLFRIPCKGYA